MNFKTKDTDKKILNNIYEAASNLIMLISGCVFIFLEVDVLADYCMNSIKGEATFELIKYILSYLMIFVPVILSMYRGAYGIKNRNDSSLSGNGKDFLIIDILISVLLIYAAEIRFITDMVNGEFRPVILCLVVIQLVCIINIFIEIKRISNNSRYDAETENNSDRGFVFMTVFSSVMVYFGLILLLSLIGVIKGKTMPERIDLVKEEDSELQYLTEFDAQDFDGNIYLPDTFKEHTVTMLNLWGTFCGPCIEEMPNLEILSKEYDSKEVSILGVVGDIYISGTMDSSQMELAKKIITETKVTYPSLIPSEKFQKNFVNEIFIYPTTLFVNSDGMIISKVEGAKSLEVWRNIIDEVIENEKGNE